MIVPVVEAKEQFTIDNGVGNGYTVYYRRKNGCYWYEVKHNDNGSLVYSKTHRISRMKFDELKELVEKNSSHSSSKGGVHV